MVMVPLLVTALLTATAAGRYDYTVTADTGDGFAGRLQP